MQRVTITFSDREIEALQRMAQVELRPAKDQVRALVRAEAQRRGLWPDGAGESERHQQRPLPVRQEAQR